MNNLKPQFIIYFGCLFSISIGVFKIIQHFSFFNLFLTISLISSGMLGFYSQKIENKIKKIIFLIPQQIFIFVTLINLILNIIDSNFSQTAVINGLALFFAALMHTFCLSLLGVSIFEDYTSKKLKIFNETRLLYKNPRLNKKTLTFYEELEPFN